MSLAHRFTQKCTDITLKMVSLSGILSYYAFQWFLQRKFVWSELFAAIISKYNSDLRVLEPSWQEQEVACH